jgi:hypothetical protein
VKVLELLPASVQLVTDKRKNYAQKVISAEILESKKRENLESMQN